MTQGSDDQKPITVVKVNAVADAFHPVKGELPITISVDLKDVLEKRREALMTRPKMSDLSLEVHVSQPMFRLFGMPVRLILEE